MLDIAAARALTVIIIAWNRPASLGRLLTSLESAAYPAGMPQVNVRFALDHAANGTVDAAMDATIAAFVWPHGEVRVRRRRAHAGLRDNVLGAWRPASDSDPPAVFLEDDIELSPLWWHWLQAALQRYASPARSGLMGVSLFTPDKLNEPYRNRDDFHHGCAWQALHARSKSEDASSALLFAQPCSWGALYLASAWRAFLRQADALRQLDARQLPSLPCPADALAADRMCQVVANRPGRSSWKPDPEPDPGPTRTLT